MMIITMMRTLFLKWIAPDDQVKFYPEFFRTELLHPVNVVKHFLTDER